MIPNKRAQTMLEYIFLITVLIAGLLIMAHFIRVRVQGKLKANAVEISGNRQFEYGRTTTTTLISNP